VASCLFSELVKPGLINSYSIDFQQGGLQHAWGLPMRVLSALLKPLPMQQ